MRPIDFTDHPLFVWATTWCDIDGISALLTKWSTPTVSASSPDFDTSKEHGLSDGVSPVTDPASPQADANSEQCTISGNTSSSWTSATLKYSDLCTGVLLYACITYIDSKDELDASAAFEKVEKGTVLSVVTGEEAGRGIDVLDSNYRHYGRILRFSSPATTRFGDSKGENSSFNLDIVDQDVHSRNGDVVARRLRNLRAVMRRIQSFYTEALNALIVMPLPDLLLIARNPFREESGEEMKKVLLLLLGCAVQSDKKEEFISKIKELDLGLQQAIVEQIKRVTDTVDCVLNIQALELDPSDRTTATVLHQLQRVIKERDSFANSTLELASSSSHGATEHESDGGGSTSSSLESGVASGGHSSSSASSLCNGDICQRKLPESQQGIRETSAERHHLAVELADIKAKLRRTRQELEEKIELVAEYREELTEKESAVGKLRQENLDLLKDARAAKEYRDELDVLREKVDRLERLEQECGKYKERLTELEFYKSRVEELREENHLLLESKHMLESQVDSLNSRLQKSASAETELVQAQRLIIDLQQELKSEREKLGDLVEHNIKLEKECQESLNKSSLLEKELTDVKAALNGLGNTDGDGHSSAVGTLSDQLNESAHAKLLRLELENQRLRSRLDDTTPVALVEQLKNENEKLRKLLEDEKRRKEENNGQQESALKQVHEMERNFRRQEEQYRREIDDLKTENTSLTDELTLTRDGYDESLAEEKKRVITEYEASTAALVKDRDELRSRKEELAMENKRLAQELARCKTELARTQDRLLEYEKEKLAHENRLYVLDRETRCVEKENAKLKQMLETSDDEFEKARTRILELEREKQKLESAHAKLEKAEAAVVELEIEKKHFAQQAELETRKCSALREDLINEKTQTHDLRTKLQTVLHTLGLVTDSSDVEASVLKVETLIQEYSCNSKRDQDNLRNRVDELELRARQQSETLSARAAEISELRQKIALGNDDKLSKSEKLGELERANASLADENKNVKQQVYLLQEELRKMQNHSHTSESENGILRQEMSELRLQMSSNALAQSDNAKMQVELRSLQLQVDVLEQDNSELQKQCNQWERDQALVRRDFEHLQRQHSGLLQDHEQLQMLHEQLTCDFEKMQNEVLVLKSQLRQHKHECLEHSDQLERLAMEKERLSSLQGRLDQERMEKDREFKTFALMQNEHSTLKKNYDDLKARYDFLTNEIEHMRSDYRNLRMDYNAVNMKATQLQAQLTDSQDLAQRKDLEAVKLLHKCDMLTQLNSTLEEESRTLMRQMDMLIAQNQGLLTRALMDKDQYHAESKEFQEKLNALRRHKEKLEEKIMEQYKAMDSPNKRQKEKLTFMKKAKALVSRPSTRKSRQKQSLNSASAAEESAMSADEGGFVSSSRTNDPYQNGGQNGSRLSSRLRERAESADSRRSESESASAVGSSQAPSEYADVIRASPLCGSAYQRTPLQQHRQFRQTRSPLNSPEISHKRSHSSASTHGAESSLSSGARSSACSGGVGSNKETAVEKKEPPPLATLPPFAPSGVPMRQGPNLIPDHVSLTGSERAVDVPCDFLSHQPPSHKTGGASPAKTAPPSYAPSRGQFAPLKTCQIGSSSQLPPTSPRMNAHRAKPRPPPPPYPGPSTRRPPPPLPTSPSQLTRFRPDLAAEDARERSPSVERPNVRPHPTSLSVLPVTAECSFEPAQTSTPKSEQPFVFDDGAVVGVLPGPNGASSSVVSTQPVRLFCATAVTSCPPSVPDMAYRQDTTQTAARSNPYRKNVTQSFYENIDDLQVEQSERVMVEKEGEGEENGGDTTATTVIPDGSPNGPETDSIWYEYGCV